MSKKMKAAVAHHAREVAELRADRELAVEYLKAAMESLDDPDDRAAGLPAHQPGIALPRPVRQGQPDPEDHPRRSQGRRYAAVGGAGRALGCLTYVFAVPQGLTFPL